jgi:hypothetical protein
VRYDTVCSLVLEKIGQYPQVLPTSKLSASATPTAFSQGKQSSVQAIKR